MKKIFFVIIAIVIAFGTTSAELIVKGHCDEESRTGWNIDNNKIDEVRMWLPNEEVGGWYSHLSCTSSFDDFTIAHAVTTRDGEIFTTEEISSYMWWLLDEASTLEEVVLLDAEAECVIEGIFGGINQDEEAVALTIKIHEEKEVNRTQMLLNIGDGNILAKT